MWQPQGLAATHAARERAARAASPNPVTLERFHVKLSRMSRSAAAGCWCLGVLAAALGACSMAPSQPVIDRLDPDTATTVTVLKKPVELVAESLHRTGGDPFAFIAPFETDRMGHRTQYLWMSAPGVENAKIEPQLTCDGQTLQLSPVEGDMGHLGLAHPPYEKPAPWSLEWYFQLPPETLRCLADAQRVTLQTRTDTGQSDQFSVDARGLATLKAFGLR